MMRRAVFIVLLLSIMLPAAAQSDGLLPIRTRITPANAADVSLYMLHSRRAERVLWSPGASLLAVVDTTDIELYSVADLHLTPPRIRLEQTVTDLAFSPDGRALYTLIPGSLIAISTVDASVTDRFVADARRIAVSPNGRQLALLARQNVVQIVTVDTRETYTITPSITPDDVAFSSDGRRLLITDGAGGGEVVDLALRRVEHTLTGGATDAAALLGSAAYSADGRRIFSQTADSAEAIAIWDARTGGRTGTMQRPAEYQRIHGWGINTRANIATGAAVGMAPEQSAVMVWALAGGEPLVKLQHPGVRDAQPSPDGTLIASVGGGTLRLWATAESLPTQAQVAQLSQVNVVAACDVFGVRPSLGQVLDGQTVSLVWSWYAANTQQVRDYLDKAIYQLDFDGTNIRPWIYVTRTLQDDVNEGYPTVYLYAPIGPVALGQHRSQVTVTWVQPISDGFADFGPGTANPSDGGTCDFSAR